MNIYFLKANLKTLNQSHYRWYLHNIKLVEVTLILLSVLNFAPQSWELTTELRVESWELLNLIFNVRSISEPTVLINIISWDYADQHSWFSYTLTKTTTHPGFSQGQSCHSLPFVIVISPLVLLNSTLLPLPYDCPGARCNPWHSGFESLNQ